MANTHPNSIFRWEDAASLEHACWQCPTKANSPRALQTCYGVHSMPCTSYHPTMHAIGAAHRCSGCVMTREMHDARHREIAELVAEYRSLEHSAQKPPTRQTPLLERPPNLAAVQRRCERPAKVTLRYDSSENDYPCNGTEHNPFATAAAATVGDENDELDLIDDIVSVVSVSSSSTPSFATMTTTPNKKPTKAEVRAQKKAKKSVKSQNKALRNQTRHLAAVTSADVASVARKLHGDDAAAAATAQGQGSSMQEGLAHPLATDRTIEDVIARNLNFVKNIQAHKQYLFQSISTGRREIKERRRQKKRESRGGELGEDAVEMDEVVSAIMIKLGVAPVVVQAASPSSSTSSPSSSATVFAGTVTSSPLGVASVGSSSSSSSGNVTSMVLRSGTINATANANPTPGRRRAPSLTAASCMASPANKTGSGCNKAMAAVAGKLRNAIKADLEKHENEVHMRYVRAGGFWRYVGKSVFERMTRIAGEVDVSTGERWDKKWVREDKHDARQEFEGEDKNDVVAVGEEAMVVDG